MNLSRAGFASENEPLTCAPATPDRALSPCYDSPTMSPVRRFSFYDTSTSQFSSAAYQRPTRLIPIVTAEDLTRPAADRKDAVSSSASECRVENGGERYG